ncbi:hypothetical protein Skr01_70150 [Sphaerisporangium krabiense]|uniref:Sulfotransferase family protein n=1 Tax=Sphaerisporangium krabiense TaxID=763782 RepID=A0A7W9DP77_9ACTN|nr:hypothetical protein [Sphaerisporangium krabiense]MBB5625030.1 hypothetical protein [Sphaerisporangium krabiense]GII66930.1 hypothetical protein Skr01_70150 [Sphaerisporangium krabiense]
MKKIALWAIPRAVGTAFERVFLERDDTTVAHEIFMPAHYYSSHRASPRYDGTVAPKPEYEYEHIKRSIGRMTGRPILFLKEIAFHMRGVFEADFWADFTHTFIIRDPRVSIPSLYKLMPDATSEETGFACVKDIFDLVRDKYGTTPIVVNGDTFRRHPKETLESYCRLAGIPFQDTTTWRTGKVIPEWKQWEEWHAEALKSSGIFKPPPEPRSVDLPAHVEKMIADALPHYAEMNRYSITV